MIMLLRNVPLEILAERVGKSSVAIIHRLLDQNPVFLAVMTGRGECGYVVRLNCAGSCAE